MKRSAWAAQAGYPAEDWDAARAEVREAIEEAARFQRLITYGELAARITVLPAGAHSPVLAHLLGEILEDSLQHGGLALTALVVHSADHLPGGGFYRMAREAGASFSDALEYWASQVKKIFEHYAASPATH